MRLAFTSDLHVEYQLEVVGLVAKEARRLAPDALLLAGDICPDLRRLEHSLRLIKQELGIPVLFLPGNHDLWCGGPQSPGPNSRRRYEQVIPEICHRSGVLHLGIAPQRLGQVALVGVTGWHDGSLAPAETALGAGSQAPEDKTGAERIVTCLDDTQVFWPDDEGHLLEPSELSAHMCNLLAKQLAVLHTHEGPLVVVTHMLPHAQFLKAAEPPSISEDGVPFQPAPFLGSAALWPIIAAHARVTHVLVGHLHRPCRTRIPAPHGEISCLASPIGYPRERSSTLMEQVRSRVLLVDITQH